MKTTILKINLILALCLAFLTINAQDFQWVKTNPNVQANDIHFNDYYSDFYVTGSFTGTVDFDPTALVDNKTSNGQKDIFVTKYDSKGDYMWTITMGGAGNDIGNSITASEMEIYITGSFEGTADFDPIDTVNHDLVSLGSTDVFLASYYDYGAINYAYSFGGTGTNAGTTVAATYMGEVFVGGYFDGIFDADPVNADGGSGSFFLLKYNYDYTEWMIYDQTTGGSSTINDICLDEMNYQVYYTGSFTNDMDLIVGNSADDLTSTGLSDIFIGKFDFDGTFDWINSFGGVSNDEGSGILVGSNPQSVYLTGTFGGQTSFDPLGILGTLNANGTSDIFLSSYDFAGSFNWAKQYGGTGADNANGLILNMENIVLGGVSNSDVSIDIAGMSFTATNQGGLDSYFIEILSNGQNKSIFPISGTDNVKVSSFALDYNGTIHTVGGFGSTVDFDLGPTLNEQTATGASDMFFAAYSPYTMYINTPPTQVCPLEPYFLNPQRKDSPGLELIWQVYDMIEWKTIIENNNYAFYSNDSLLVKPDPSTNGFSYRCIAKDNFSIDTLLSPVTLSLYPLTDVVLGNDTTVFPGQTVTIDAGPGYVDYSWNTGENTQAIDVDSSGYFIVTITDAIGCTNKDTLAVNVTFLVTIDTATNKIMAVWGRSLNPGTESLNIYRVSGSTDVLLTSIDFSEANQFYDDAVSPDDQSFTYAFERKDESTGDSAKISRHVTMFLNVIRDPQNNSTILSWNPYEGLSYDTFYVYRGPSQDDMELIGKVKNKVGAKNFEFIDAYFTEELYYRVEIEAEFSVLVTGIKKSNSGPFSRSLSNLEDNRQQIASGIEDKFCIKQSSNNKLLIYPNPMNQFSTIVIPEKGLMNLRIIDISGKLVKKENGILGDSFELFRGNLDKGLYIVVLQGENMFKAKLIVE